MSRHVIVRESPDTVWPGGFWLQRGSVTWDEDQAVCLMTGGHDPNHIFPVIGNITDLVRDDSGNITGEVNLRNVSQEIDDKYVRFSPYLSSVLVTEDGKIAVAARLRGVYLYPKEAYPANY